MRPLTSSPKLLMSFRYHLLSVSLLLIDMLSYALSSIITWKANSTLVILGSCQNRHIGRVLMPPLVLIVSPASPETKDENG